MVERRLEPAPMRLLEDGPAVVRGNPANLPRGGGGSSRPPSDRWRAGQPQSLRMEPEPDLDDLRTAKKLAYEVIERSCPARGRT